jgi:hypothetical protein
MKQKIMLELLTGEKKEIPLEKLIDGFPISAKDIEMIKN